MRYDKDEIRWVIWSGSNRDWPFLKTSTAGQSKRICTDKHVTGRYQIATLAKVASRNVLKHRNDDFIIPSAPRHIHPHQSPFPILRQQWPRSDRR